MSKDFDSCVDHLCREIASRTSRRSFLGSLGLLIAGTAAPLLPVLHGSGAKAEENPNDKTTDDEHDCSYWKYCGIDGWLCSCCGGAIDMCPPGAIPSPIAWLGTCYNPADQKHYVISYNDCCGVQGCVRCYCNNNEDDREQYQPQRSNSITWCMGKANKAYHCSTARVLAVASGPAQ